MHKVEVTVHKDILVITTNDEVECEGWVPAGDGKIGCVLIDTKGKLGISEEALAWLKSVEKSCDAIGDVDAWKSDDGPCFSWLGGPNSLKQRGCTGSRGYNTSCLEYDIIPNQVPEEAVKVIEENT